MKIRYVLVGFGIYESHAEYANLKVLRPWWTPRTPQYEPGSRHHE